MTYGYAYFERSILIVVKTNRKLRIRAIHEGALPDIGRSSGQRDEKNLLGCLRKSFSKVLGIEKQVRRKLVVSSSEDELFFRQPVGKVPPFLE
jgi:hypothetical protein